MSAAAASGIAGIGGSIFGALGNLESGAANALSITAQGDAAAYQAQVARNNATIAGYNSTEAEQAGVSKPEAVSLQGAQTGAKIKTSQAANNIDVNSGSAVKVQDSQREVSQLNTATTLNNADLAAYGYRNQAKAFTEQAGLETLTAEEAGPAAEAAETGAALNAAGSLLSGASSTGFKFTGGAPPAGTGSTTTNNPTLAGSLY